jgi:hypothetical protein
VCDVIIGSDIHTRPGRLSVAGRTLVTITGLSEARPANDHPHAKLEPGVRLSLTSRCQAAALTQLGEPSRFDCGRKCQRWPSADARRGPVAVCDWRLGKLGGAGSAAGQSDDVDGARRTSLDHDRGGGGAAGHPRGGLDILPNRTGPRLSPARTPFPRATERNLISARRLPTACVLSEQTYAAAVNKSCHNTFTTPRPRVYASSAASSRSRWPPLSGTSSTARGPACNPPYPPPGHGRLIEAQGHGKNRIGFPRPAPDRYRGLMTRFQVEMSDESGGRLRRAAASEGVDPDTLATALVEANMPRHLFLTGAQACIDEFGEAFVLRFGPSRPGRQVA